MNINAYQPGFVRLDYDGMYHPALDTGHPVQFLFWYGFWCGVLFVLVSACLMVLCYRIVWWLLSLDVWNRLDGWLLGLFGHGKA